MKKSLLFVSTFLVTLLIQSVIWQNFEYLDKKIWSNEARYIYTGDKEAFNPLVGYGHPGGPPLEITLLAHGVFGISYEAALAGSIALLNALIIAGCATMCYVLRPQTTWWLVVAGILACNRLYPDATPPSAIVSPLIVLIFLTALWLYEKAASVTWGHIALLGAFMGVGVATRSDITPAVMVPILLLLVPRIGWKNILTSLLVAAVSFTLTNPFMWIMPPWKHLWDLFI